MRSCTGQPCCAPAVAAISRAVDIGFACQRARQAGDRHREGMTLVPLKLYFNEKGCAKIELALARGKKLFDNRETEKKRSWERERGRLMRQKE